MREDCEGITQTTASLARYEKQKRAHDGTDGVRSLQSCAERLVDRTSTEPIKMYSRAGCSMAKRETGTTLQSEACASNQK